MAKEQGVLGFYEVLETGEKVHRLSSEWFSGKYHPDWRNNLSELGYYLRRRITRGEVTLLCDCCGGRLYPAGKHYDKGEEKSFGSQRLHLRHFSRKDQKIDCVYTQEEHNTKEEIDKDAHINKRESPQHFKLKAIVKAAIENEFPECVVEMEQWMKVENNRRRPDINLRFLEHGMLPKGKELSIEIQVRPILMTDINRRMDIDKAGGKYMMWVMESFNPDDRSDDELYKEDIYSAGGLNAFVLDEDAIQKTEETGRLHLKVWYDKYKMKGEEMDKAEKVSEIIPFSALKFEEKNEEYCVFYHPSIDERDQCLETAEKFRKQREAEQKFQEHKEKVEREVAALKRVQEEKEQAERNNVEKLLDAIFYGGTWSGDVQEMSEILVKKSSYFRELFEALKSLVSIRALGWNLLADVVSICCAFKKAYPTKELLDEIQINFKEFEDLVGLLMWALYPIEKIHNPHQFSMSQVIALFPDLSRYVLNMVSNPNYRISKEDIERAKAVIKNYKNVTNKTKELGDMFCDWSAFLLADRIFKSEQCVNKNEMLILMRNQWKPLCIFLSMQMGFIVGFGFKKWVDFADYLKKNYPEFVRKFLETAIAKGYSLQSNKRNQKDALIRYLQIENPQTPPECEQLLNIIFPKL